MSGRVLPLDGILDHPDDGFAFPHDLEAERSVLGACLLNAQAIVLALTIISAEHFYRHAHQLLFRIMRRLHDRGSEIDLITIKAAMSDRDLESAGGPAYIAALLDTGLRSANVEHYARIVKDCAARREIIYISRRASAHALDAGADIEGIAAAARQSLADLTRNASERRCELVNDVDLLSRPDPELLIEGRVLAESIALIVGPSGIGKTALLLDLLISIAGLPSWLGARVGRRGIVVAVIAEGLGGAKRRVAACKQHHGLPLTSSCGLLLWPQAVNLLDRAEVDRFIAIIRPYEPVATGFDTYARCTVGGDENSARDTGIAIANLDRIRTEVRTTPIVTHHTGITEERERGSSALRAAVDTLITLRKADDLLTMTCTKQKDIAPFADLQLSLTPVRDGSACVVTMAGVDTTDAGAVTDIQLRLLRSLRDSFDAGGASTAEWRTATPGVPEWAYFRAVKVLHERGYVSKGVKKGDKYRLTELAKRAASSTPN